MSYLTRDMARMAIQNMKHFHDDLESLYTRHNMNVLDDLGRRNILMSTTQEKYFAAELNKAYPGAINDGRPGQPDIVIPELDIELECKLTSRHKSGAISFQTDFETLRQKGSLDYLYMIASESFDQFAVLHFKGLTVDDFRAVSSGSRGKVSMYKHKAMSKCNVLIGNVVNNNILNLEKLHSKLDGSLHIPGIDTDKVMKSIDYWTNTPARYSFQLESV